MKCFLKNTILLLFFLQAAAHCLTKPFKNYQQIRQRNYHDNNGPTIEEEPFKILQKNQQVELKAPTLMNFDSVGYKYGLRTKNDDFTWLYADNGNSLTTEDEESMKFSCNDNLYLCWLWRFKNNNNPWFDLDSNDKKLSNRKEYLKPEQEEINFRLIFPLASQKGQQKKQQLHENDVVAKKPKIDYDILLDNVAVQRTADENNKMSKDFDNFVADVLTNFKNSMPTERDKRVPLILENTSDTLKPPHFPSALTSFYGYRNTKRIKSIMPVFSPSISAGVMTDLGKFFQELSKNVHFAEKLHFGPNEHKLLEGDHPLNALHQLPDADEKQIKSKTAEFLNAIRSYRPSQKIRSLVAMNPEGYHGSQYLDPNYMWIGLGK